MAMRFLVARVAVLAALVVFVSSLATTAFAFTGSYRLYLIEGYLDRAPNGVKIIDRIEIGATGEPRRQLLVTSYRSPGEMPLDRYLSRERSSRYLLWGKREDVSSVIGAPEGSVIKGTFVAYQQAIPSLLIASLDRPV